MDSSKKWKLSKFKICKTKSYDPYNRNRVWCIPCWQKNCSGILKNINLFFEIFDKPYQKFCWSAASLEFWMIGGGWLGWKLSIIKMNGYNFRYCTIGSLLQVLLDVGHEEARRNGLWNMTNFTIMARYLFSTKIRIELWPSPGHEEIGWFSIYHRFSNWKFRVFCNIFFFLFPKK